MPAFARSFSCEALAAWDAANPANFVRQLFARWALPGERATVERPLRLCIRDGYLNFYAKGQSVAELSRTRKGPRMRVHRAYVSNLEDLELSGGMSKSQYLTIDANALALPSSAMQLDRWISRAEGFACAEKRFVDDLVAENPGVVELEMALPASDIPGASRVAPRMDLVLVQIDGAAMPTIAFWEAKCSINSELRAKSEYEMRGDGRVVGPKVVHQVHKYVAWMQEPDRSAQVAQAYRLSGFILIELHRIFRGDEGGAPACLHLWKALAACDPVIVEQPGVVVGNYCPEKHSMLEPGRFARYATSFVENGHREKLGRNGIIVHQVPSPCDALLPLLPQFKVAA